VERIGAYKAVTGKPEEKRSLLIPSPGNIIMDHKEIRYMELPGLACNGSGQGLVAGTFET
jgi:hypothetical protein